MIELSTIETEPIEIADLPATTALSVQMRAYAQGYIDARKRAGDAWLSMGMFLSKARAEAKYGEWGLFLAATNTNEDWAKRLIAIYAQSQHDRKFADAMRTNFLSVATGYELISAPPDVQDRLLSGDTPPTQRQIRDEKRVAAKSAAPPTLEHEIAAPAPDLDDILLRLDAHGYAKSGTRQKGITTFYSFRDYSGRSDETGGELEMAEGELPIWLSELDSHAAYAQAKQERYLSARDRAERLDYDLKRDGAQFLLTPAGKQVPALRGTLDSLIKAIEGYEKNAAKQSAEPPSLPSEDEQHAETIRAILKEAADKGERTGTRLYQQAYDHAREIHDVTLYNKMIALIDRATDVPEDEPPPPPTPRPPSATVAAYDAQVRADEAILMDVNRLLDQARQLIGTVKVAQHHAAQVESEVIHEQARAFSLTQRDRMTRMNPIAMISLTTFTQAIDHIDALLSA